MKIEVRKGVNLVLALAVAITLGVAGCSSGGGDSAATGGGTTTSADLKGALYPTLSTAPVVSSTLLRQTSAAIGNASVTYVADQTGVAGFGNAKVAIATAATDITYGVASFAVPAGSYEAKLSGLPVDLVGGENASYITTESVSASSGKTYQADQYAYTINSPFSLSSVTVQVYQTDSAGTVDRGNYTNFVDPMSGIVSNSLKNPIVYQKTTTLAGVQQAIENVELFKGSYRVVITGTPSVSTNALATNIGSVFTVAGGGLTSSQSVTLAAPSKAPTVTLLNTSGVGLSGYTVYFYESANKILLGSATTLADGVASVGAPSGVTGVVAAIYNGTTYKGVYVFSDINSSSATTLQQFTVQGQIQPSAGALDATAVPTVYARMSTNLGRDADAADVAAVPAIAGSGTYTLTLFGGTTAALNYKIGARSVKGFPDVTKTSIALNGANLTGQQIAVSPGGVILGKIQTEGKADLAGETVAVYGTAADGVIEQIVAPATTNTTGDYTLEVPYGTYFLMVRGAVTDGISVSAGAPTAQKSLTRFSMTGQVSKSLGTTTQGANTATVVIGTSTATTSSLGTYTINVMEGKNWICAKPNLAVDATYSYKCNLNVLVDASTVAAARK